MLCVFRSTNKEEPPVVAARIQTSGFGRRPARGIRREVSGPAARRPLQPQVYNQLLNAWIRILFASDDRNVEIEVSAFDGGTEASNPKFRLSNRTGFARRVAGMTVPSPELSGYMTLPEPDLVFAE